MSDTMIIRATCVICGDVELRPDELRLFVSASDEEAFYIFTCPGCFDVVQKSADTRVRELLAGAGVQIEIWSAPSRHAEGPPLTYNDVIDLHELLEADDWFDKLLAL